MTPRYTHTPDVVATPLPGDELVLLRLDTQEYFSLNETSSTIWSVFASPASVQDATEALLAVYEVDPETAQASAESVVAQLVRDGLLIDAA